MTQLEIEIALLEQLVKKMSEPYQTGAQTPHEIVGRMLIERQKQLTKENKNVE